MKALDLRFCFEVFNRPALGKRKQSSTLIVTLHALPTGIIALNQAAYDALGAPEMVELLYERRFRIIGIRASQADHAIPVRNYRGSAHHISAGAFYTYFGLTLEKRRVVALMVDGILHVPLEDERG